MATPEPRSTPARLTAPATAKLPRPYLLALAIIYIFAGLYFRDPWKPDDVIGLATMLTGLNGPGHAAWLPQVGDLAYAQDGPLVMWVGMAFISLFSPLLDWFTSGIDAQIIASRLPNIIWFVAMVVSVWYGTYLLGRRPEPQPLRLPFGGEPSEKDYGRMIADAALLLILATAGIMWRMHETSEVPAIIAMQSLALFAVVRTIDRPMSGAIVLGIALGGALLARGFLGGIPIWLSTLSAFALVSDLRRQWRCLPIAIAIAAALFLLWYIPAQRLSPYWVEQWWYWHSSSYTWPRYQAVFSVLRDLPWFLWPTWPFAIMAIWQWRSWLKAPHIAIPLAFTVWPLVSMLFLVDPFEPEYALMAVPCALLAAFALPTLRRGMVNSLDWFAVMCFSLTIATVWLGWVALQAGWPRQISNNIALQTSGYHAYVSWPAVIVALAFTLAWVVLVRWRLKHKPAALWRGTVLSAGGIVTTWLLLVTLWMPALDYVRSYRPVSAELAAALQKYRAPGECLRSEDLGLGQRASFYVFNGINIRAGGASRCTLVLVQVSLRELRAGYKPLGPEAQLLWQGKRGAERQEAFQLLRIANP